MPSYRRRVKVVTTVQEVAVGMRKEFSYTEIHALEADVSNLQDVTALHDEVFSRFGMVSPRSSTHGTTTS